MEWKLEKYSCPKVKTEGAMVLTNIMTVLSKDFVGVKRKYPFGVGKRTTKISYSRFKRRMMKRLSTELPMASSPTTTRWQHACVTENDTVCKRLQLDSPPHSTSFHHVLLGDQEKSLRPESAVHHGKRDLDGTDNFPLEISQERSQVQCSYLKVTEQDCIWTESGGDQTSYSASSPFSVIETTPSIPCSIFKPELRLAIPGLQDDYYLNLLSWSEQNMVALGLASSVYIWNADTHVLEGSLHLKPHISDIFGPSISSCPLASSIAWSKDGHTLAIGKSDGEVQLWDVERRTNLRKLTGHLSLVGSLSCNQQLFSSGSLLGFIHHHDLRVAKPVVGWVRQKKGICGLAWCPAGRKLASGTTDGLLSIWPVDPGATGKCLPLLTIPHPTAVKICSLYWCTRKQELLTGHGLPHHQITCWKMPFLTKQVELYGHSGRVLHLTLSPCGTRLFTAGSDLQACVWKRLDQLIRPQET